MKRKTSKKVRRFNIKYFVDFYNLRNQILLVAKLSLGSCEVSHKISYCRLLDTNKQTDKQSIYLHNSIMSDLEDFW